MNILKTCNLKISREPLQFLHVFLLKKSFLFFPNILFSRFKKYIYNYKHRFLKFFTFLSYQTKQTYK